MARYSTTGNNKSLFRCAWCDEWYCGECSNHDGWERYCSDGCEKEAKEEKRFMMEG